MGGHALNAEREAILLCFDFTKEEFGKRLDLPFESYLEEDTITLSWVSEERLAVYESFKYLEIWITNKIEPSVVV